MLFLITVIDDHCNTFHIHVVYISKNFFAILELPPQPKKIIFKDGFPCDSCDNVFIDFESLDVHVCPSETVKQGKL